MLWQAVCVYVSGVERGERGWVEIVPFILMVISSLEHWQLIV